jgi:integrase/recombinase XerD
MHRTPQKEIVKKIIKIIKEENPNYDYLANLFKKIRIEINVKNTKGAQKLPFVPTEKELKTYYDLISSEENIQHMILIRTLLYTGVRVSELVNIEIHHIDFKECQIRIPNGKGNKSRVVPFPQKFKETLFVFVKNEQKNGANFLFESIRKNKFTTRGINKILEKYTKQAGIKESLSPHKMRHFLFTWLKKQGIDDALIQPYSGHESRKSLEIYSKLSLCEAQEKYEEKIKEFPF